MNEKILINAIDPEECRIAKVIDSKLADFHIESASREILHGNIYKGIITRVEPSLQAVFVDFGSERHGFLQIQEIHSDYYQETKSGEIHIDKVVKRGQELLIQVTKDPIMSKGAMLTTFISLPGRYVVLMPGSKNHGISRKIEDEEERKRLKEIVSKTNLPEDFGIIIRTAGEGCSKTMLSKDIRYLMRVWRNINQKGIKAKAPATLFKERNLSVRAIRDYYTQDISEILIDDDAVYNEIKNFVHIISPKNKKIVKLYKSDKPIFTKFQLEDQISSIFENRVSLKSGGSIVIEQTEALVSIDVNSGRGTRKKNIEETALMTNLEAAEEIARQLKLRDLGGLVVVDFIDMKDAKHRYQVEKVIKDQLRIDKARTKVGRISKFGLLEMSRQRLRPSIDFGSFENCAICRGKGQVPSSEMLGLSFLRKLKLETLKDNLKIVKGIVPDTVASYLLNKKRKEILELENRRKLSIIIESDGSMRPGESRFECQPDACEIE
ncbi:MAG: Rne/Rng family ribonuclease [Desulfobacteraceae bacterium]|nr:Rne/Rng family ribonuclease [Desulfobacteraceae bacterium]